MFSTTQFFLMAFSHKNVSIRHQNVEQEYYSLRGRRGYRAYQVFQSRILYDIQDKVTQTFFILELPNEYSGSEVRYKTKEGFPYTTFVKNKQSPTQSYSSLYLFRNQGPYDYFRTNTVEDLAESNRYFLETMCEVTVGWPLTPYRGEPACKASETAGSFGLLLFSCFGVGGRADEKDHRNYDRLENFKTYCDLLEAAF